MKRNELMELGKATGIFKNIYLCEESKEDKILAIKMVVDMGTHNGFTKQEILNALYWLISERTPKAPDYYGDGYVDGELVYDMAKCPVCEHEFEYGINDWGSAYCPDCGQLLDWSEQQHH